MSTYRRLFFALGCASWLVSAGCSDSPTAQRTEKTESLVKAVGAMGPRTDMIEDPIPGPWPISVTNSNGTPLISWSALSGATSYTVSLLYFEINANWEVMNSWAWELTTTTSTSYLDTGSVYTGSVEACPTGTWDSGRAFLFAYAVQATFPHGTSDIYYSPVEAPISPC